MTADPTAGPAGVPAAYHGFLAMVFTKKNTNLVLLQSNQYFLQKTNDNCIGELHLRLPPYPLSTYPPGGDGSRGRIPNILPFVVGGE